MFFELFKNDKDGTTTQVQEKNVFLAMLEVRTALLAMIKRY